MKEVGDVVRVTDGFMRGKKGPIVGTAQGFTEKIYVVQFRTTNLGFLDRELTKIGRVRTTKREGSSPRGRERGSVE